MVVEKVDSVVRADFREVLVSAAIQMHSIPLNYPTPIYSVLVAALALDPVVRATPDLFSLGQVGQVIQYPFFPDLVDRADQVLFPDQVGRVGQVLVSLGRVDPVNPVLSVLALDLADRATPDLFSLGQVGQANPVHRALALRVCILSHRNIASNMYPAVRWQMHSNFR